MPVLFFGLYALWTVTPWGVALEERLGLETLFQWRGARPAPPKVVVLAVTRESAHQLGLSEKLYEWSRSTHAQAVQELQQLEARLIVFDIFFERDRDAAGDEDFEEALLAAGNVLLFARSDRQQMDLGDGQWASQHRLLQPYEPFARAALATGPLILPKIPARVNRFFVRHPVLLQQFTLPMLAHQIVSTDAIVVPASQQKQIVSRFYNFYGPPRSITSIDFATLLLHPEGVADQIKDAVVFIGFSALLQPDQRDGFYTAFTDDSGLDISGVELAATAFANLQDGSWLRVLPWYINLLLVASYGMLCFLLGRRLTPVTAVLLAGVLAFMVSLVIQYVFTHHVVWLFWVNGVLLQTPIAAGLGILLRSRELQQQKLILQRAFGKYLPAEEIDRLMAQEDMPATRRIHNSICLVTDAQGFSRLSENLSPVELSQLMQDYYAAVIGPIRAGGGLISDVAGDGVIALWPHLDRAQAWVQVAPVITALLDSIDDFNAAHPDHALPTRIGLHAGEMVLGHFGAADHYEFRAMGDLVNTTSRLEGVNKQIGTRILLSEDCLNEADEKMRNIGRFKFVGKDHPLRLFTLIGQDAPDLLRDFGAALNSFESGQWQQAAQQFRNLSARYPQDGPSEFFSRYLNESRRRDELMPYWEKGIVYLLQK